MKGPDLCCASDGGEVDGIDGFATIGARRGLVYSSITTANLVHGSIHDHAEDNSSVQTWKRHLIELGRFHIIVHQILAKSKMDLLCLLRFDINEDIQQLAVNI